jgi:uncharacterized protein YbjT (DUF2867 family)
MILVTGATGNIGRELLVALRERGGEVRALVHGNRPSLPPGVSMVTGNLDEPSSLLPALDGVRGLFLLPGYRDMPGVLAAARHAGVEQVVLLSGLSAASGDRRNAISAYMIRSEEAVYASGLSWTVIRPVAFMSNALRWLPKLAVGDLLRLPFASVRSATVHPGDVAAVAAECLLGGDHERQVYLPTGPESLTPGDQVKILARVLNRDLRFEAQPDTEARAEMLKHTPVEYVDAFFDFYVAGTLDESEVRSTVQDLTGRPPRTFEQWATEHRADFQRP